LIPFHHNGVRQHLMEKSQTQRQRHGKRQHVQSFHHTPRGHQQAKQGGSEGDEKYGREQHHGD
jgi:hypothetical protein